MLKVTKNLFDGEKVVRGINRKANEFFIDQLVNENLDSQEKEHIAELAKKALANCDEFEEDNSKFWYKYGLAEGQVKGVLIALGAFVMGSAIGGFISKK